MPNLPKPSVAMIVPLPEPPAKAPAVVELAAIAEAGAAAERGDSKPVAEVIRFLSPRPSSSPAPPPMASPEAWSVPGWLTAPVLAMAIPHSPLAWGNAGPAVPDQAATVGFAGIEEAPPQDAVREELAEAPPTVAEPPAAAPETVEPSPMPDPAATDAPVAAAAEPTETLAQALRRSVGDGPAARLPDAPAADRPLPRSIGEPRPGVRVLRAERPLGAPQAAVPRPVPAASEGEALGGPGLPAANPPSVMVEPQLDPAAATDTAMATDTAVATRPADRPAIRNRRLYRRVSIDAGFEIDGAAVQLLDISMGGFAAAKAPTLAPDMTVPVKLQLSVDGVDISTAMRARMVYCAEPRSGGRFIDLTASQTALLRYIVTWRGQAVGALGTTTLLDAITRWPQQSAPDTPALPPVPPERRPSWWSRALGWLRGRSDPDS